MQLSPLTENDFPALFDFEQRNEDYFRLYVPARPSAYRQYETFCIVQRELMKEQDDGISAFFVGYEGEKIVVRVNLNDIDLDKQTADIGYRTCQSVTGKGITSQAVAQVIDLAKSLGITELTATVAHTNPASERILIKNQFDYLRTQHDAYELNDKMLNFRYYRRAI